jgi:uncharacterized protein (DUF433 family)
MMPRCRTTKPVLAVLTVNTVPRPRLPIDFQAPKASCSCVQLSLYRVEMKRHCPSPNAHSLKLVCETRAGLRYEYYPLGRFVVIALGVCGNRPTFKGTRVEVETVLDCLRAGRTIQDILKSYPSVSGPAVREAIWLATRALADRCARQAA